MKTRLMALGAQEVRFFFWLVAHNEKKTIAFLSRQISRMGDGPLYALIGLGLWLFEPVSGKQFFYTGLVAYALELPLYWILKNSIKRDRPCHKMTGFEALIEPSDKFSFPSGHTAAAFVFATVLTSFYPMLLIPAYLLASLVGLSRVLLGVHYPTDILAGMVVGLTCSFTALAIV